MTLSLAILLLAGGPNKAASQEWTNRHQAVSWLSASAEQPLGSRWALLGDASTRRVDQLLVPQQFIIRSGLQYQAGQSVRFAAGYAYSTSHSGGTPASREQRLWQQIALTQKLGAATVSHRYRLEQRWISSAAVGGESQASAQSSSSVQHRLRYLGRLQAPLPRLSHRSRALTGAVQAEWLLRLGGPAGNASLAQYRVAGVVGVPLTARLRLDGSYMVLTNVLSKTHTNDSQRVMSISWAYVGLPLVRQAHH